MSIEGKIQQITSAIESGRYEKAFSSFHAHFKGHKGLGKYADLAGRFNAIVKSFAEGAMTLQDYMVEENKLIKSLLAALNMISDKFKYKATRKRIRVEFTLNGKLVEWTEAMAKKLTSVLSNVLDVSSSSINIVNVSAGSIKIVVELAQTAVTALLAGTHVSKIQNQLSKKGIELTRVRPSYEITKVPIKVVSKSGNGSASILKLKPLIMVSMAAVVGAMIYFVIPTSETGSIGDETIIESVEKKQEYSKKPSASTSNKPPGQNSENTTIEDFIFKGIVVEKGNPSKAIQGANISSTKSDVSTKSDGLGEFNLNVKDLKSIDIHIKHDDYNSRRFEGASSGQTFELVPKNKVPNGTAAQVDIIEELPGNNPHLPLADENEIKPSPITNQIVKISLCDKRGKRIKESIKAVVSINKGKAREIVFDKNGETQISYSLLKIKSEVHFTKFDSRSYQLVNKTAKKIAGNEMCLIVKLKMEG